MKKQFLSTIIATIVLAFLLGTLQAQTVTLTFTGKDANNQYVQLNRVAITNLTKGWQETIYWPDTTLTMQNGTGIDESVAHGGFALSQNNPNPFTVTTDVNLTVADAGAVTLEILDGNGKIVGTHRVRPEIGTHQFRISLSAAGTYVMTARQNGKMSSIKMVCNGAGKDNRIEYIGMARTITYVLKSTTNNPFTFGDQMEYVGYATINGTEVESQRITQALGASQTFVLQFAAVQHAIPTVTTNPATNISATSATVGGMVTSDGGENVFDRGICYSTTSMPTISDNCIHLGQGTGSFSDTLNGLLQETTYYVRAFAINSIGVGYGSEVSFTTETDISQYGQPCPGVETLTDIDGNVYNTVLIGTQCWMKENLRTTKYADSTTIAQGSSTSTTMGYWYYPDYNSSNMSTYGLLYNWKAVMRNSSSSSGNPSGVQGICPNGWHVPSDAEWTQLTNYVSSQSAYVCGNDNTYIASALAGTVGWNSSTITCAVGNTLADNNATGFSALPAGFYIGSYSNFGTNAYFWSATMSNSNYSFYRLLSYYDATVYRYSNYKYYGFSVRCVRD